MKTIKAFNLYENKYSEWDVPSKEELLLNSKLTWGKKYDKVERELLEGGLPMLMSRIK